MKKSLITQLEAEVNSKAQLIDDIRKQVGVCAKLIEALLCDPDNTIVIHGSQADKTIIRQALDELIRIGRGA